MIASGRYGAVDGISQLQNWNLDVQMTDNAQANSFTRAAKTRDANVQDWTGGATYLGSTFPAMSGFVFTGYTAPANGVYGGVGKIYTGHALWNSVSINGDASSGGRVNTQVQFGGDGALTVANGTVTDTIAPVKLMAHNCVVKFNNQILRWKVFSLNITNEVQQLVDSGTGGWNARYEGILDFTGSVTQASDVNITPNGTVGKLEVTCGELLIFSADYVIVTSFGGMTVDPSSGAIIEATTNFGLVAHDGAILGKVCLHGTQIWPPQADSGSGGSGSGGTGEASSGEDSSEETQQEG